VLPDIPDALARAGYAGGCRCYIRLGHLVTSGEGSYNGCRDGTSVGNGDAHLNAVA